MINIKSNNIDISKTEFYFNDVSQYLNLLEPFRQRHPLKLNNKTALLILDAQDAFFSPKSRTYLPITETITPQINRLSKLFINHKLPVIQIRHFDTKDYMKIWWKHTITGEMSNLSIKIDGSLVILKHHYDAFWETELKSILIENGIEHLILTGVMTHLCIDSTAKSAFMHGFKPVLPIDAIGSKNELLHLGALLGLAHGVAYISTTEEIETCIEKLQ